MVKRLDSKGDVDPCSLADSLTELAQLRLELQERDDILAMAAHELRNPLHALGMQLTLARSTAEVNGHAATAARIVRAEATLARYVDRVTVLMDLMRAQAQDYPLAIRAFDLVVTLREMVEALTAEVRFRSVKVTLDLPDTCITVNDALVVEQVVDNLLLNALKHSACTDVSVRLRCRADEVVEIEVKDNGRGIAMEDQHRIFSKFHVAEQSPRGSGTGLGLWIVRKLLAAVGGDIDLQSQIGVGTVFKVTLPKMHIRDNPA
ncbi:hypothetical protein BH09PSE5_BH09PSE5_02650 [soil metagenome]